MKKWVCQYPEEVLTETSVPLKVGVSVTKRGGKWVCQYQSIMFNYYYYFLFHRIVPVQVRKEIHFFDFLRSEKKNNKIIFSSNH